MVKRLASSSEIADAAASLTSGGVEGLTPVQKRLLARVFVDEIQKGAFDPDAPGELVQKFAEHVKDAFPADGEFMVVRDYRAMLRRHAEDLGVESPPVTSLILYATAIEHWLNAMIITASLQAGLSELDASIVVKRFSFPDKVAWLRTRFDLPAFEAGRKIAIQRLVEVRNEVVHYKWKGVSSEELSSKDRELQDIVSGAGALLDYLEEFEFEHIAQVAITAAIKLFKVKRSDLSRRSFRRTA